MLLEFNLKDNKTSIWVASAHIKDRLDLFRSMLVLVMIWSARAVAKELNETVIMSFPTINY